MSLNKRKMVREIGRRSRLKNREVQLMLETLIDVWTESLMAGEKIELENFLVLEVKEIDRGEQVANFAPRYIRRVTMRVSKRLKTRLHYDDKTE